MEIRMSDHSNTIDKLYKMAKKVDKLYSFSQTNEVYRRGKNLPVKPKRIWRGIDDAM